MNLFEITHASFASRIFSVLMASLLLCQPVYANLTTCGGSCSTCPCNAPGSGNDNGLGGGPGAGNGTPDGVPGSAPGGSPPPSGFPDGPSGGLSNGIPAMPPRKMSASPASGNASISSLNLTVNFGRAANEDVDLISQFSVYAQMPSPLLATTQYLQYRNWLLDRILQTEVATQYAPSILGEDWRDKLDTFSVYGRVMIDDAMGWNVTHQVRVLQEKREAVVFQFTNGSSVGRPIGDHSTLAQALVMLDASGEETSTRPAFYELRFGGGSSVRYAAANGRVVSCTTATGRTITPSDAGLEAIYDGSGLLRQVRSEADGLADIVSLEDAPGYELRFYALSQISGQEDGLYTVAGNPHTIWRLNASGDASTVLITRISGSTEDVSRFEYSHNSEGWMKTGADSRTVTSMTSSWDSSLTTRTMTIVEKSSTGAVASKRTSVVRKYPFGERTVVTTSDPDGARLVTSYTYYDNPSDGAAYGRQKSENHPDGSWTLWRYDAHGRVAAVVTPWKNAALNSSDADAKVELKSYSPVDARDSVAATDTRPRTEETRILGVTTSKTYHAYYIEDGCRVEVQERCVRPDAAYGDADNLRTVLRNYPDGAAVTDVSAGRLRSIVYPSGVIDSFSYEKGTWTPGLDDATPGVFTPGNGHALRVTATRGTTAHPDGIAFRTLQLRSVRDESGNEVLTERLVYTGDGYERMDWTAYTYDAQNRELRAVRSNGEVTATTWSCCAKASETLPDGRTYLYEYDVMKRLVAKTLVGTGVQPDLVTSYEYDAVGNQVVQTIAGGSQSLTSSSSFDLAGRPISTTDTRSLTTVYTYLNAVNTGTQLRGETTTVTHPSGAQTILATYCDGKRASITGDAQVSEYYDYGVNADGTQWTIVRSGGGDSPRWTKTTTDMIGRVVKTEKSGYDENAVVIQQNSYDAIGRLIKSSQPGMADTLYEYDELGSLVRIGLDADGNGTLDLASNDRITETTSAYMQDNANAWWTHSTQSAYATADDATPTVVSATNKRISGFASGVIAETRSTDIHGNATVTTTTLNRATKTITQESLSPESTVTERRVTVNGLLVSVRSKSNLTTHFGYDGLRRRISVTAPRTGTSTITYNQTGQTSAETDAAGNTTSYGYDNAGRLAWRKNALDKYTRYAYNSRGQQTRIWGDTEYPVEYGYDQYGQKVTMTTFRTGTSWNGQSWPNPVPQGDTTTWNYDATTGLLTSKVYADGNGSSYTYTTDGKLATRTWARKDAQGNDLVTTYSYNLFGELTDIGYSDSTPDITYSYNRIGKLSQVTDVVGTRTFAYNATLDEVSESITGVYNKTIVRYYTSTGYKGKKQGLAVDTITHYTYGYDPYGRMNQLNIPSGSFNYTRLDNSDLVAQMTRPNGITTTWSYETNRDLITQVQNGTVSTYGYVNDAIGRRTSISRAGSAYATPDVISYTYNDRSELTGAASNADAAYAYSYTYDPIGNRITASEASVPWTYTTNNLNQYTSATVNNVTMNFAYDLDGNMTYRPVDATSGWTQIWNGENRMVETYKATDRLTFKYDYMGRRVEKCVYSGENLTSKTLYVYDGFKCVEELDALNDNAVTLRHTWQPFDVGLDVILATTDESGTTYFLHDANKNVMQMTSISSVTQEIYAYTPFGMSTGNVVPTFEC